MTTATQTRGRAAIVVAVSGILFAIGLALGGMTRPSKVIGFLDVTGAWDASLAFVMAGALVVFAIGYARIERWSEPLFDHVFRVPDKTRIDWKLIVGAMMFGAGWGLSGFCPGPALLSLVSLDVRALVFVGSMLAAMAAVRGLQLARR